jgi:hypothetical protein
LLQRRGSRSCRTGRAGRKIRQPDRGRLRGGVGQTASRSGIRHWLRHSRRHLCQGLYIHVSDLGDIHRLAHERLRQGSSSFAVNCGYGPGPLCPRSARDREKKYRSWTLP